MMDDSSAAIASRTVSPACLDGGDLPMEAGSERLNELLCVMGGTRGLEVLDVGLVCRSAERARSC